MQCCSENRAGTSAGGRRKVSCARRSPPSTSKSRTPRDAARADIPPTVPRPATATSSAHRRGHHGIPHAADARGGGGRAGSRLRVPHLRSHRARQARGGRRRAPRRGESPGFAAMNITHPCKQLVLDIVDELDPDAEHLGAVNLVVFDDDRLIGYNTDWMGYRDGLIAGPAGGVVRARRADRLRRRRRGDRLRAPLVRHGAARPVRRRRRSRGGSRRPHARSLPDADRRDGRAGRASRGDRPRDRGRPCDTAGDAPPPGSRVRPRPAPAGRVGVGCRLPTARDRAHPAGGRAGPSGARRRPDGRRPGIR